MVALERQVGARGLRSVIEEVMERVLFDSHSWRSSTGWLPDPWSFESMVGVSAPRRLGSASGSIHHAPNPVSINDAAHQLIQWATTLREGWACRRHRRAKRFLDSSTLVPYHAQDAA